MHVQKLGAVVAEISSPWAILFYWPTLTRLDVDY